MLQDAVRQFLAEVRKSPAAAVGPPLEQLEHALDSSFEGAYANLGTPIGAHTWMVRALLKKTDEETATLLVPLGEPVEIVGFLPTLLGLAVAGQGAVMPPLEAFDVTLKVDRKDVYTSRAENAVATGEKVEVVNLPMIDAKVSNRLIGLKLKTDDPVISVQFRWAVALAMVATLGFIDTQISLGIIVRPTSR